MITGRPRSSKLLPVPPEHGHLCGGGRGGGRGKEEEEDDEEEEGRVVVMLHGERAKRMVWVGRLRNGKDGAEGGGKEGRERSSSDRRRDGGVQEQRLLLMSRVTQPKAP